MREGIPESEKLTFRNNPDHFWRRVGRILCGIPDDFLERRNEFREAERGLADGAFEETFEEFDEDTFGAEDVPGDFPEDFPEDFPPESGPDADK